MKKFFTEVENAILITLLEQRQDFLKNHCFANPFVFIESERIKKMLTELKDND